MEQVFAALSEHIAKGDGRSLSEAPSVGCTPIGDTAKAPMQATQVPAPMQETSVRSAPVSRSVSASLRCIAQTASSTSRLPAPSSDPASGSDGSCAVTSCGNATPLKRGAVIVKAGIEYRIASVSKTGVVKLNNLSGGFAMYSHINVCKQLELSL